MTGFIVRRLLSAALVVVLTSMFVFVLCLGYAAPRQTGFRMTGWPSSHANARRLSGRGHL